MTANSVAVGEVHTGLLHNSMAVSPAFASQLLDVMLGERVRRSDRPISHVTSPPLLTGVDCLLPTSTGAKVHAVGTVVSRANITGGHIVQGSAYVTVRRGRTDRRLPWSHYLAQAGIMETITKAHMSDIASGFLDQEGSGPHHLDLDAISRRTVDNVQDREDLDHRAAFRVSRTRLRWIALPRAASGASATGAEPSGSTDHLTANLGEGQLDIVFAIPNHTLRTLRLTGAPADLAAHVEFCEDIARHDWLLTTLQFLVERSRLGSAPRLEVLDRLQPALDHMLHLWMPAARTDPGLVEAWRALEDSPGLSRQWQAMANRIRDQVAMALLEAMSSQPERSVATRGS